MPDLTPAIARTALDTDRVSRAFLPRWLARSCSVALSSLELFPPVAEPHVEWNNKFKAAVKFQIFDVPTYNFK